MKIGIANDHAATKMKFELIDYLTSKGYEVVNYGFDTEDNHIYGFYQDPDDINHYVRLVFDDEMKLINNEINDVLDDMEVTLIIPKKMNLDKKTVINYAKNIFRDYENLNYIDNEKLLRSGMYLQ